jgi:hypothetical protein
VGYLVAVIAINAGNTIGRRSLMLEGENASENGNNEYKK